MHRGTVLILLGALIAACGCQPPIEKKPAFPDARFYRAAGPWTFEDHANTSNFPAFLAGGGIGAWFGPLGTGIGADGKPLPLLISGDYDANEKHRSVPNPLNVQIKIGGQELKPLGTWNQTYNARSGILTTSFKNAGPGGIADVTVSSTVRNGGLVSRWAVSSHGKVQIDITVPQPTVQNVPSLEQFRIAEFQLEAPEKKVHYEVIPGESSLLWQPISFQLQTGQTASFSEVFVYSPTLRGGDQDLLPASSFRPVSPDTLGTEYSAKTLLKPSAPNSWIDIDGPTDDQAAVHRFLSDLMYGEGAYLTPFGLSNTLYDGHVFWDADMWMAPVFDLFAPDRITALSSYRLARLNAHGGQPWPWESAVTGKTATSLNSREIHIVGDVLWQLKQAQALGLIAPRDIPALKQAEIACRSFWESQMSKNPDGTYSIKNVVSPDENHKGDNDLFTNLLAQWTLNGCHWSSNPDKKLKLPRDSKSFLTYDHDPVRSYKQAAAILSLFPLQYPPAEKEAQAMIDRFSGKVIPNGPAMSEPVTALLRARFADPDTAYDIWEESWKDYVRGPFFSFNEKKTQNRTIFMTGEAGCLNTVIYGFAGIRIDSHPQPGSQVQMKLKNGQWLSVSPHLPATWKGIVLHHIFILGKAYTLTIRRDGAAQKAALKPDA